MKSGAFFKFVGLATMLLAVTAMDHATRWHVESSLKRAMRNAGEDRRFLMVEFAAAWCGDCRALSNDFRDQAVHDYMGRHFDLITVDVGEFNKNLDIAQRFGVDIQQGIPTAVFFGPDGTRIGATNKGELASAGNYGPAQILQFLREIVEDGRIDGIE